MRLLNITEGPPCSRHFCWNLVECGEPHGREMGDSPSIQIESWIQQQWAMLHDQKGVLTCVNQQRM